MIVPVNRTFNGRIPVEEEFSILLNVCSEQLIFPPF